MKDTFEARASASSDENDTTLAVQGEWAPQWAPLEVPRQTLERRAETVGWLPFAGRLIPRDV